MTSQAGRIRGWSGAAIPLARRRRTRRDGLAGHPPSRTAAMVANRRQGRGATARRGSVGSVRAVAPGRAAGRGDAAANDLWEGTSNGRRDRRWPPWPRSLPPPLSGPGGRRLESRSQGRWPANRGRWGCCRSCRRGPTFARPRPRRRRAFRPARPATAPTPRDSRPVTRVPPPAAPLPGPAAPPAVAPTLSAPASTTNSPAGLPVRGCLQCRLTPRRVQRASPATGATTPGAQRAAVFLVQSGRAAAGAAIPGDGELGDAQP